MPDSQIPQDLNSREILELLRNRKKIQLVLPAEVLTKLLINLRVIKSRDTKLLEEYGMENEKVIIKCKQEVSPNGGIKATLWIEFPKKQSRFSVFVIDNDGE